MIIHAKVMMIAVIGNFVMKVLFIVLEILRDDDADCEGDGVGCLNGICECENDEGCDEAR